MQERFGYVLNPLQLRFEPIYAVAMLLDMNFTKLLDLPQFVTLKDAAVRELRHLVS